MRQKFLGNYERVPAFVHDYVVAAVRKAVKEEEFWLWYRRGERGRRWSLADRAPVSCLSCALCKSGSSLSGPIDRTAQLIWVVWRWQRQLKRDTIK
jgi:hypothetical protein